MSYNAFKLRFQLLLLVSLLFFSACIPFFSSYKPVIYENTVSLKHETLDLMENATEPYANYQEEIDRLKEELNKAYEYVEGVSSKSISTKQWMKLINPDGNLIGKFFRRWEEGGSLSKIYIDEFKIIVSDAFDEIINTEAQ